MVTGDRTILHCDTYRLYKLYLLMCLTATEMANTLQAELTDQRKHADDLRTKIRWLEDSLEMSKKGD